MALSSRRSWLRSEVGIGVILLGCVVLACLWRNGPLANTYETVWRGKLPFHYSVRESINNILMTFFFFVVTLEIRKEFHQGAFHDRRNAIIPMVVGVLGMVGPCLICAAITYGTPAFAAWPIPCATDIALSLGVLSLASEKIPAAIRPFMATMALVDDIGGILLVALLYTRHFHSIWGLAAILLAVAGYLGFKKVSPHLASVLVVQALIWYAFDRSGVNASLSGVVVAYLIPARDRPGHGSYIELYERLFKRVVNYLIVPVFLLANAGADLRFPAGEAFDIRLFLGVGLGLLVGKSVSIYLSANGLQAIGIGKLPTGANPRVMVGFSFVGGVGLKMCVFLVPLALHDPVMRSTAILGIYAGLATSALIGTSILHQPWRRTKAAIAA